MSRTRLLTIEKKFREKGFVSIVGIDEAGRGPLAGPVYAAACFIPKGLFFSGVDDSKKLAPATREELFHKITTHPDVLFGIAHAEVDLIDQINILQATFFAMRLALAKLPISPDLVLIDGSLVPKEFPWNALAIPQGDSKSQMIAAASILAKVPRDARMKEEHLRFPGYGFDRHFGYGTPEHFDAIKRLGACPIHRKSFSPFKKDEDPCSRQVFFPG